MTITSVCWHFLRMGSKNFTCSSFLPCEELLINSHLAGSKLFDFLTAITFVSCFRILHRGWGMDRWVRVFAQQAQRPEPESQAPMEKAYGTVCRHRQIPEFSWSAHSVRTEGLGSPRGLFQGKNQSVMEQATQYPLLAFHGRFPCTRMHVCICTLTHN